MTPDLTTDVLVIGAGPAGSMTAKWAAKHGAQVLMIEKRQEIGSPVRCGEGMSKDWLPEVGIKPGRWVNLEVEGARIYSPSEKVFEINEKHAGNEVGYVVERDEFDKALAIDAANAGVEVLLKTAATSDPEGERPGRRGEGQAVRRDVRRFGRRSRSGPTASRARSAVGPGSRPTSRLKDMDTCLQYRMTNVDSDVRFCDFYLGKVAPGGYVWIFPKGEGLANVGIGVQVSQIKGMAEARDYLDRWIAAHPAYAKGKKIDMVGGGVSISPPLKQTVDRRVHDRRRRGPDDRPPDRRRDRQRLHRREDLRHGCGRGRPGRGRLEGVPAEVRQGLAGTPRGEALPQLAREGEAHHPFR